MGKATVVHNTVIGVFCSCTKRTYWILTGGEGRGEGNRARAGGSESVCEREERLWGGCERVKERECESESV